MFHAWGIIVRQFSRFQCFNKPEHSTWSTFRAIILASLHDELLQTWFSSCFSRFSLLFKTNFLCSHFAKIFSFLCLGYNNNNSRILDTIGIEKIWKKNSREQKSVPQNIFFLRYEFKLILELLKFNDEKNVTKTFYSGFPSLHIFSIITWYPRSFTSSKRFEETFCCCFPFVLSVRFTFYSTWFYTFLKNKQHLDNFNWSTVKPL